MARTKSGEFDQIKYQNEFIKTNYDRINLLVPKGKKEDLKALAAAKGQSLNTLINQAIEEYIKNSEFAKN